MRHGKSGRKLGRNSSHRKAMWRNMVTSVIDHERITTTLAKAKEGRGHVERVLSIAIRLGDVLDKPADKRTRDEQARYAHAMTQAAKIVRTREALHKLFHDVAPRFRDGGGGYTRVVKVGRRAGDAAELAILELTKRGGDEEAAA